MTRQPHPRPASIAVAAAAAAVLLAGCADEARLDVDATLLPGEGSPVLFELVIDDPDGEALASFDPEQHVRLETAGGTLAPSIVNVDPASGPRHAEYGIGFTADRGQDLALLVQGLGDERRFEFEA